MLPRRGLPNLCPAPQETPVTTLVACSTARQPRPRQRLGPGRRLALALRRRLRRRRRIYRLIGAEHVAFGLAVEELYELLALDRLPPEQDVGHVVELVAVLLEHLARGLVGLLHHPPDLIVDLAGDLVGVVGLRAELASQEGLAVVVAEHARSELL